MFARRGFADASMEEIAQAAGLAKGTLYLYYDSKRELYRAALRAGLVELCEALERAIGRRRPLAAQLEAYVTTKVAYFDEHRGLLPHLPGRVRQRGLRGRWTRISATCRCARARMLERGDPRGGEGRAARVPSPRRRRPTPSPT